MIRLLPIILLAGCTTVQTPIMYSGACPTGDRECQRNRNAETLHYLGQSDAALELMCDDLDVLKALGDKCGMQSVSYIVY